MNIEKTKKKFEKKFEKQAKKKGCKGVKVMTLTRKDFKKELSTTMGFGFQDLRKNSRILITDLMANYELSFIPKDINSLNIKVTATKKK